MAGHPSAGELVAAVRDFRAGLAERGALTGRDAFHAKVAANVLAIVERELAGDADAVEGAVLASFLPSLRRKPRLGFAPGGENTVAANRGDAAEKPSPGFRRADDVVEDVLARRTALCTRIRAGELTAATPGLLDALIVATCARLAVDNPRYPTLARLQGSGGGA